MLLDKQNLFSDDQAVTESVASTNVIDLGADDSKVQDLNERNAELLVQVTEEDFAEGTSVAVSIQEDDDEDFGDPTTLVSSDAIAVASLVQGYKFKLGRVLPLLSKRYLRAYYTVVGTPSAGKITAGLLINTQTNG
jgi:hypothetical protein